MENQAQQTEFHDKQPDPGHPDLQDTPWWIEAGDQIDLGYFFVPGSDRPLYLNPTLRDWLGMEGGDLADENELWDRICALAVDPERSWAELQPILNDLSRHPLVRFPIQDERDLILQVQLYSFIGPGQGDRSFAGFVSRVQNEHRQQADLVNVFKQLLAPARQHSAAVQGNLRALSGNFQAWSPDVLSHILEKAQGDLDQICSLIDMGLSFAKVIDQTSLYRQSVPLVSLVEQIIRDADYSMINLRIGQEDDQDPIISKIDRGVLQIALEIIFKEIVNRNPAGHQLDLRIAAEAGSVVLSLEGPRTLPLPGLVGEGQEVKVHESSPELFLAREILAAQGGNLIVDPEWAKGGEGLRLVITLPAAPKGPKQAIRQDWRDLFETGTGRILLAEAQPEYQLSIREGLTDLGYRVDLAGDGSTVLDLAQTNHPDLIILARNLPGMDGLLVTQGIRRWSAVPIIMISMRENLDDLLYAYRLGVDDYLQKPFLLEELLAKVEVFISRQVGPGASIAPEMYQEGMVRIDHGARQVWVRGEPIQLTPIEYNLLVYLSRQGKQIVPYEQLLEHVWEGPEKGSRQGLFVHVRRLREKIEPDPKNPQIIGNKWGVGYVFNP